MSKDFLVSINTELFDKSIQNCINQINAWEDDIDDAIQDLTYLGVLKIAAEAKKHHAFKSQTGTLVRSIHVAPFEANHDNDEASAENTNLIDSKGKKASREGNNIIAQIGSWLRYAYAIETGKHHEGGKPYPYLLPAFESKHKESQNYIINGIRKILEKRGHI